MTDLETLMGHVDSLSNQHGELHSLKYTTRVGLREQVMHLVDEGVKYPHAIFFMERTQRDANEEGLKVVQVVMKEFVYGSDHMEANIEVFDINEGLKFKIIECCDGARMVTYLNPFLIGSEEIMEQYGNELSIVDGTKDELMEEMERRKDVLSAIEFKLPPTIS